MIKSQFQTPSLPIPKCSTTFSHSATDMVKSRFSLISFQKVTSTAVTATFLADTSRAELGTSRTRNVTVLSTEPRWLKPPCYSFCFSCIGSETSILTVFCCTNTTENKAQNNANCEKSKTMSYSYIAPHFLSKHLGSDAPGSLNRH